MPILSIFPTPLLWFRTWRAFWACTVWITWQTIFSTTGSTLRTIISTTRRVRAVSITTGRAICVSTTTISSCRSVRVSLIVIGHFMQLTKSMFSITSVDATFLLRISLWSVPGITSMNSMRDLFRIKIPIMSIRSTPFMILKLIIKLYVLGTLYSRRMQSRGHKTSSYRRYILIPRSTTDIVFHLT